jgi:regulator of PEP synthase PpsR (kinase-PPPase family)
MRRSLETRCRALGLPAVAPLDPVNDALSNLLGQQAKARPGRQHVLDAAYFARVDAIQFTIAHDDGIGWENWEEADIVLAGVSRTSKTPTSIYLAHRGIRAANVPLVPGSDAEPQLLALSQKGKLIIGLTASPDRLIQIRRNRLLSLHEDRTSDYVDQDAVREEIVRARRMFERHGWPIIDVSRRSVEETAAAIINLLSGGRGQVEVLG